ncbi:MAG: hypothetical protein WBC04_23795 [Candidatus Acidiferrales bacterium]
MGVFAILALAWIDKKPFTYRRTAKRGSRGIGLSHVAKRKEANLVEYTCRPCGGYDLLGVFHAFLPFIDHLIGHLCLQELRELSQPFPGADGGAWFRNPDTFEVIRGLPLYEPDSPAWRRFLKKSEKLLPQASVFLPDVADWLERALASIGQLNSITQSDLFVAEQLVELVQALPPEFQEQREYLLKHKENLKDTGMDPKWLKRPGRQVEFVAGSMAGARWKLTPSSSRELIRKRRRNPRGPTLRTLKIRKERYWWEPQE